MRHSILTSLAWTRRLARQLMEDSVSGAPWGPRSPLSCRYGITVTIVALAMFAATACTTAQTSSPELIQTPVTEPESTQAIAAEPDSTLDPEVVVSALINAMGTNDAEQIRSLFDANASQAYGDGPAKSGEAFFRWLDSDIIQRQGRVENAKLAVNGNEVVLTGQYQSQGYRSEANFLFTVEDGRITSWRMRY